MEVSIMNAAPIIVVGAVAIGAFFLLGGKIGGGGGGGENLPVMGEPLVKSAGDVTNVIESIMHSTPLKYSSTFDPLVPLKSGDVPLSSLTGKKGGAIETSQKLAAMVGGAGVSTYAQPSGGFTVTTGYSSTKYRQATAEQIAAKPVTYMGSSVAPKGTAKKPSTSGVVAGWGTVSSSGAVIGTYGG